MPRFAILEHDAPGGRHWDLLLQHGESLRTWALQEPPRADAAVAADPLPDHRPLYLDYEGPVSGDRGTVAQWDAGVYETILDDESELVVQLSGHKIRGRLRLIREAESSGRRTLTYEPQP